MLNVAFSKTYTVRCSNCFAVKKMIVPSGFHADELKKNARCGFCEAKGVTQNIEITEVKEDSEHDE